jgi:hypothetical protein
MTTTVRSTPLFVTRITAAAIVVLLLRPAAGEDDLDEVVTDERIVEVLQHIGIDGPEHATRPVLHTIGERTQNPVLEIGSRMGSGDRLNCLCGQIVATKPSTSVSNPL